MHSKSRVEKSFLIERILVFILYKIGDTKLLILKPENTTFLKSRKYFNFLINNFLLLKAVTAKFLLLRVKFEILK